MPASEFTWNTTFKPVFQVYGTKRKANNTEHNPANALMQQNSARVNDAKRRCIIGSQPSFGDAALHNGLLIQQNSSQESQMDDQPMSQENIPLHKTLNRHLEGVNAVHCERIPSPWPSSDSFESAVQFHHSPPQPAPPSSLAHASHPPQTEQHIMDLNEGTFNTYAGDVVSMDSDLAHQCNGSGPGSQHGQENTNMSNNVRCFCRPTWDCYLDDKPWVSDYY